MKRPTTSIIMPVRNMERYLSATLKSAINQTSELFEIIVVDDKSTDRSAEIVREQYGDDPRVRLLAGPGQGVSVARNLGAAAAEGSILLFLDGDDLLAPDALERFEAAMFASEDASAVLGGLQRMSEQGRPLPGSDNRELVPETKQLHALVRKNFVVNGGNLAVRKSAFMRVGGFPEHLKNGEDWVFWCRLAAVGRFAILSGDPILRYRQVSTGANALARRPLARVPSIETIANDEMIQGIVGDDLHRLLNLRRADYYWSGVRNELLYGARLNTLYLIVVGMFAYPQSFTQPYIALRFFRSLALRD